jgi:hypothetical protein
VIVKKLRKLRLLQQAVVVDVVLDVEVEVDEVDELDVVLGPAVVDVIDEVEVVVGCSVDDVVAPETVAQALGAGAPFRLRSRSSLMTVVPPNVAQ